MKTNKLFTFVAGLGLLLSTTASAQLAMTRSTFTGAYTPISLPAATLSTATGDDVAQSAIPIGFTFNYLGNNFTTIGVNTNGAASFDATMSTSGTNNNLYVANAPNNTLAPWWDNLISDTVLYQLQGTPGSQTFTIQWTNSLSYFNTATQRLNFQIVLHETTNEIEFMYGPVVSGVAAPNESASIGIEGATGGAGNYIDAVTGSSFTSNGMLNAATEWPSHHFRFTPGAPTAIAGGTYTVGVTGNYYSLSEALADLNHRGIAGAVNLTLIDPNYDVTPANGDNFFPMLLGPVAGSSSTNSITINTQSGTATITSEGTLNGNCGNAAANNVISNTNEPIFALVGATYVNLQNLSFTCSAAGVVDRGLSVLNSSATAGSQNNTFQNISVQLNRGNTGCIGISQQAITTPTAATGANSNNTYSNLDISNVYIGMYLNGNANFPDANCSVGTTSATLFNHIGAATPNDIGAGMGNTATYGIRANNQNGVSIFNNEVRNLSHSGTSTCEGIVIDAGVGNNKVYMNMVHDINYTGTTATANITGIRANLINTGVNTVKIYNNFVYAIGSSYAGNATPTRAVRGIFLQSAGGGTITDTAYVDFNSVRLDLSAAPNLSSTCFESGATNGPVMFVRNNIFANFSGAQTGNTAHYAMATPTTTAIGNTGSVSNYNDLYIDNTANGFVGIGQATQYVTLANWQTGMTQDANSINADPAFNSPSNLHVTAVAVNNVGNGTGSPWVTVDIDNTPRFASPDMGADEFTPLLYDVGVTSLVDPVNSGCHTNADQVNVVLKNFAAAPLDFTVDQVTVIVHVTGATTQTLTTTIISNALNGNVPLASGASMVVPMGTINMSAVGTYTFDGYAVLGPDANHPNDTMNTVNIDYGPGVAVATPSNVCAGSPTTLTLVGYSAGGTIQWQSSTDNGNTWNAETGTGATTDTYVVTPTSNTWYQVIFCGSILSNIDTINYYPLTAPTVADDTVCGPGSVTLNATGNGTLYWYAASTGGVPLASGPSFTTNVSATTTFYVSNTSGNLTQSVGLFDNSAGGNMSASNNSVIFDVFQNATLTGVYVYPATAGNVTVDLADNTNTVIASATVAVTAADVNQRTFIPLNFTLTPGTGYFLQRNAASVNLWRNNVGVNYPYVLPGVVSINTSTAGNGLYYFFYDWQVNYGCESARVPMAIVVTTPPAIAITASATTLCAGDSTTLTATSGNSGYTFNWSPSASLSDSIGAAVVATPANTTQYFITAVDSLSGCRALDSILVSVNVIPPSTITAVDTLICAGQADTLTVSYPASSVGLFDNSAGGNMSASLNNLIFDVFQNCTLSGVYVYPAAAGNVVIDLADNTNAILNTVTFAVTAADVNQRTFIPLNFNLTPATGMQLLRNAASVNMWRNNVGVNYPYTLPGVLSITTSTAGNGFYYFFYDWQITSGTYSFVWSSIPVGYTGTGDSAFVAPTVTTQYIVTITDSVTGCSTQVTKTIAIATPISVSIVGSNALCLGDSTTLVAVPANGDGTVSYLWSNSLGTNDSVQVIPTTTTTYSVTATDGCGNTSTATQTVNVSTTAPTGSFTYTVTGLLTFAFTDNTTGATSYAWDFGDTQTSTAQNPTNVYAAPGTYTVTLIASNGCGSDTITQILVVTGIESTQLASELSVSPNPTSDVFVLTINHPVVSTVTIQLFDIAGHLVATQVVENLKAENSIRMDVSSYAKGMYVLKVNSEVGGSVMKVVVE